MLEYFSQKSWTNRWMDRGYFWDSTSTEVENNALKFDARKNKKWIGFSNFSTIGFTMKIRGCIQLLRQFQETPNGPLDVGVLTLCHIKEIFFSSKAVVNWKFNRPAHALLKILSSNYSSTLITCWKRGIVSQLPIFVLKIVRETLFSNVLLFQSNNFLTKK